MRTPQIRFTFLKDEHWMAAVALEHPSNDIDPGQHPPDRRGRRREHPGRREGARSHRCGPLQRRLGPRSAGGILRQVGYDTIGTDNNEPKGHKTGWGVDAPFRVKASPGDAQAGRVYGRGSPAT